jgi:hypothetical protein
LFPSSPPSRPRTRRRPHQSRWAAAHVTSPATAPSAVETTTTPVSEWHANHPRHVRPSTSRYDYLRP